VVQTELYDMVGEIYWYMVEVLGRMIWQGLYLRAV
jgi:hypothetical protein